MIDYFEKIYVMNNLTNSTTDDRSPAWSPDGTKIAFVRMGDILVMNVDGSDLTNSTNRSEWSI